MLQIDGSHGQGGGQIVRTAVSLAAIGVRAVRIEHIRVGRANPGLRPQHLTAVRALAAICGARLDGDQIGSLTLSFRPTHAPQAGEYTIDVADASRGGSAGSVGLVLQTVFPALALAISRSTLTIRGGTHVPWAPSLFYLEQVYAPAVAQMGAGLRTELHGWGFYPAGGGEARFVIDPAVQSLRPYVSVERGQLENIVGVAVAMNLPAHIPQRMSNRAESVLSELTARTRLEPVRVRGRGPAAALFLAARYTHSAAAFCAYGRKGLPSEQVADAACSEMLTHHRSGAPVDRYLADQLLVPMALADGRSEIVTPRVSSHLKTNAWVIEQLLGVRTRTSPAPMGAHRVVVEGTGQ